MINSHALSPPLSTKLRSLVGRSRGPSLAPVWSPGARLELLETATMVTECDWMGSYGRA